MFNFNQNKKQPELNIQDRIKEIGATLAGNKTLTKEERKELLGELKTLQDIQNSKTDVLVNVAKGVGMIAIMAFFGMKALKIDQGGDIVQNKTLFGMVTKWMKPL